MYKKYSLYFILMAFLFLSLIALFNYQIDPANLFNDSFESKIAKIMIDGDNVVNVSNFDERKLQKEYLKLVREIPESIVLGSSRTMVINKSSFKGKSFFNHSVSGASLEDIFAIINLYDKIGKLPREIILGVDPWFFNYNCKQGRWKSYKDEFYELSHTLSSPVELQPESKFIERGNTSKYFQLISLPYLKASIKRYNSKIQSNDPIAAKENILEGGRLFDGSIVYPVNISTRSLEDVDNIAMKFLSTSPIYSLGEYEELDENLKLAFKKILSFLKSKKVVVYLVLAPYHPLVYDGLNNRYRTVIENAESFVFESAQDFGIKVLGSYNPEKTSVSRRDFSDGMHVKGEYMNKIILNLVKD